MKGFFPLDTPSIVRAAITGAGATILRCYVLGSSKISMGDIAWPIISLNAEALTDRAKHDFDYVSFLTPHGTVFLASLATLYSFPDSGSLMTKLKLAGSIGLVYSLSELATMNTNRFETLASKLRETNDE